MQSRCTDGPPRNWKGIGIAMVVILAVMSLVLLSVIVLSPGTNHEQIITKVQVPSFICYFRNNIVLKNCCMDRPALFSCCIYSSMMDVAGWSTVASPSGSVCSRDLQDLSPPDKERAALQFASWGPQGNQLAYVFEGDIYYKQSVTAKPLRLSTTEQEERVINGLADWTYEEEILLSYAAHWWSEDGARLAYLSINNSATPVMEIPHFLGSLYPSNTFFPYPKAGSNIPSVSLFVVNLYGPAHTLEMLAPDSLKSRYHYISMVTWISSTRLAVRWLNRAQNQSVLCVCEATTGACSECLMLALCPCLWMQDVPLFSSDSPVFYTVLPAKQGASGEFHHIANLSAQPATPSVPPRFLTSGNWDVTSLCALDEKAAKMYVRNQPHTHTHLKHFTNTRLRQCVTCKLIDGCQFFKAAFSPNNTHFILYCLGGTRLVTQSFRGYTAPKSLGTTALMQNMFFPVMHLKLSLPQGFETNHYPLLVMVDSIPGSQSVAEEFELAWPQVLVSAHSVALAWVDGRSIRGQKTTVDPRKIGALNVKDHLAAIESVSLILSVMFPPQAFGGYLTLKMLAATDDMFQCAAAVAPITDFRLYSAAFSERYLGLPAKEEHSYSMSSLLGEVNKLKNEDFLIVHGTADGKTRVHFQHSAELLSRLVKVEANYSLQLYPDEGHVLKDPRSIVHFQRTVVNYLHSCLQHLAYPEPEEEEDEEDD
uniref:Uncharacterized protein n=1 Tax=Neogobius melanostomus TaxID=47308 RepID=A0A8C6TG36_9GOBI